MPILIRAGKSLPMTATEAVVRLQRVPQIQFGSIAPRLRGPRRHRPAGGPQCGSHHRDPREDPGGRLSQPVSLDLDFAEELGEPPQPYEHPPADALRGDDTLFPRWEVIEETWRIVQPLLEKPPRLEPYAPGTWGPKGADALAARHGGWREPLAHAEAVHVDGLRGRRYARTVPATEGGA